MRYLLDTNAISDLIRDPRGPVARRIRQVGESNVATSVVVAAELRYGAAKKGSEPLATRVEAILGAIEVLALEPPADAVYGRLRVDLERKGAMIGGNDLLIAAHAQAAGCTLVTDNEREFRRIPGLRIANWRRPGRPMS